MRSHFTSAPKPRRSRQGSALLLVLWLIGMLMMILYSTIRVVKLDMDLTIAQMQAFRCNQLCESAINYAVNPAVKRHDGRLKNFLLGEFTGEATEGESVLTTIRTEESRLNINTILAAGDMGKEFMTGLLEYFVGQVAPDKVNDAETKDAIDRLTDTLQDWVDTDSEKRPNGMEQEDFYQLTGSKDMPFNRPFTELDELNLVPGFEYLTSLTPAWRDYFTVHSTGQLDLNDAKPEVIAVVISATQDDPSSTYPEALDAANRLDEHRRGQDGEADTEDDQKFQSKEEALAYFDTIVDASGEDAQMISLLFGVNGQTTHIEATATVGEYRKRAVLIMRGRDQGNPQIIFRKDIPLF